MNRDDTWRASFLSMTLTSVAMLCGMTSTALPLFTGGRLTPVRTILLVLFTILFLASLALAIKNRPRNSNHSA